MVKTYLEYVCIDETTILKWVLNKQIVKICVGLVWVRTGVSGEHLRTQQFTFRLQKFWE